MADADEIPSGEMEFPVDETMAAHDRTGDFSGGTRFKLS